MSGPSTPAAMRRLARKKLDLAGGWWRDMLPAVPMPPRGGWISAIRTALGMSQTDLARRLGVRPSSIAKMESSERAGTIRMETLRRAADSLECDLVIALVPRSPLQSMVEQERLRQYRWLMERAATHMDLENQPMSEELRRHLLEGADVAVPDSALWRTREDA